MGNIANDSYFTLAGNAALVAGVSATNCYYNKDICTLTESVATGLTTSEMKSANFVTMLGSSFKRDTNNINNGYPIFTWE